MRKLTKPLLRLLGRDDRGAIGVLVAVLFGGGVLLGMAAMVVDVGQIYQNRAELQNGADAGALAVARQCILSNCGAPMTTALSYANSNASALTGNAADVKTVCGLDVQNPAALNPCPASIEGTALTACPEDPTNGASFVDVLASTKLANGSTLLPPVFARALVGGPTYNGETVKACAQAEWGFAQAANTLALTISVCQWQDLTGGGGSGFNTLVPVYIKGKAKQCAGPAGLNMPGGFDWLQTTNTSPCTAYINLTTSTTVSSTGAAVSSGCKTALQNDINARASVFVPVFGCPDPPTAVPWCPVTGTGANAQYYIIGLASFVITGYSDLSGQGNTGPKAYGNYSLCINNDPCLEGYFSPGLSPVSDYISTTGSYGFSVKAVKLSG